MKLTFTLLLLCILSLQSVFAQKPKVLILAGFSSTWFDDVKAKLDATNFFSAIDYYDITSNSPKLAELKAYNAVMLSTDDGADDPDKLGDTLAAYIEAGGGVVNAVFSNAGAPIAGKFHTDYELLITNDQDDGTQYTLGTIDQTSSPLVAGVSSFDGGESSYRALNPTLASGAIVVAEWSDGQPLIVYKQNVGPLNVSRVDINFYPPSSDARSDFWVSTTDGGLLMGNALVFVATATVTSTATQQGITLSAAYPNPNNGSFTLSLDAKSAKSANVQLMNMYGQAVYSKECTFNSGSNAFEISTNLPKGMYVLNVDGEQKGTNKIIVE